MAGLPGALDRGSVALYDYHFFRRQCITTACYASKLVRSDQDRWQSGSFEARLVMTNVRLVLMNSCHNAIELSKSVYNHL
jgi:hypothetical protein